MTPEDIINTIIGDFDDVVPKASWGETSLFCNPGHALPHGVYFCTIKEKNGDNDTSSGLDREGVFRLSIGIGKAAYVPLLGKPPARPNKGGIIDTGHDFTACDVLMPHPIYGWMSWVQILNPSESSFIAIADLITGAHKEAIAKFTKRMTAKK
jgi:hypothetical protein